MEISAVSVKANISIILSAIKNDANRFHVHVLLDSNGEGKFIDREHSHANTQAAQAFKFPSDL